MKEKDIDREFFLLYEQYSSIFYNIIRGWVEDGELAQDILYRSFLQVHREFHNKPLEEDALVDWMLNIVRNLTCAALANLDWSRRNISISAAEFREKECMENTSRLFN